MLIYYLTAMFISVPAYLLDIPTASLIIILDPSAHYHLPLPLWTSFACSSFYSVKKIKKKVFIIHQLRD